MKVKLNKDQMRQCEDFALVRTNDSLSTYQFRGELRRQKIYADILYGTIAEFAVHTVLPGSTAPDLTIYDTAQKSFAKDLVYNGLNIHVKSQGYESAQRYGLSWIFQRTDPVLSRPSNRDVLALCCVESDHSVTISGFIPAKQAQFKDLKVSQYRNTKLALYNSDVLGYALNVEELNEYNQTKVQDMQDQIGEENKA